MSKGDDLNNNDLSHTPKAVVSYASLNDLKQRFGESALLDLTDRNNDEVIDACYVKAVLIDADGVINSYLASADYKTIGTNAPAIIIMLACDITFYRLHPSGATDEASNRYKEAIRLLERIADGKHKLDLPKNLPDVTGGKADKNAIIAVNGRNDWGQHR